MTFTEPLALFALAVAGTPLLIYLLLRRRKTEVNWGASYLLRLTLRTRRKSSLWKQLLVLAIRILILAGAVFLLARPFEKNPNPDLSRPALPEEAVHRVVLLDHSLSMTAVEGGESRRTRQERALRGILAGLRSGDTATLVSLLKRAGRSGPPEALTLTGPINRRSLHLAMATFQPRSGILHLGSSLSAVVKALAKTPETLAEIYLLSDFPRELEVQAEPLDWFRTLAAKQSWRLALVNLADPSPAQSYAAIHSVALGSDLAIANVPLQLYVDASCFGDAELRATFQASINREAIEEKEVRFKPNERLRFAWPMTFTQSGETIVTVRTDQARLAAHTEQSVVLRVHTLAKVWVIADEAPAGDSEAPGDTEFALRAFRQNSGDHATFQAEERGVPDLTRPIPDDVDVILLAAPRFALAAAADSLLRYVRKGGGLVLAGTRDMELAGYNERYARLLPARLSGNLRAQVDPGIFSSVRPALEIADAFLFREFTSRAGGDLPEVRIYNALQCSKVRGEVVFRLANGAPALLRRRVGRGWVYLWTSSLGIAWNSMPVRQVFVPFLTRLVHAAMSGRDYPANVTPGQTVVIPWADLSPLSLTGPGRKDKGLEPVQWKDRAYVVLAAPETPGLYQLRGKGPSGRESYFTVKGSLPEGDLRPLAPGARGALSDALGAPIYDGWEAAVTAFGPAQAKREFWPRLLCLMLAFYLFEAWFVRKL